MLARNPTNEYNVLCKAVTMACENCDTEAAGLDREVQLIWKQDQEEECMQHPSSSSSSSRGALRS